MSDEQRGYDYVVLAEIDDQEGPEGLGQRFVRMGTFRAPTPDQAAEAAWLERGLPKAEGGRVVVVTASKFHELEVAVRQQPVFEVSNAAPQQTLAGAGEEPGG